MSKVFIAHKSVDRDRATKVQEKLEALGVPVFIDVTMGPGENYLTAINRELASALAVLVLWSKAAAHLPERGEPPNFVLAEAEEGYHRGVLVSATLEKMERLRVAPFNVEQFSDVSDWIETAGPAKDQGWQKLLKAIGSKLNRPGLPALAIALESNDEEIKKKFLRDFADDPAAQKIATQLELAARSEFEQRFSAAQKRIERRKNQAQVRLDSCKQKFEQQVANLRAGRDFMPPDPVAAIDDNIAMLSNQIEIYEGTLKEQRARAEQAEASASSANAEKTALEGKIVKLQGQIQASQSTIEELRTRADQSEATATHLAAETAALGDEVAKLQQQIHTYEDTIEEQRRHAAAADALAVKANAEIATLKNEAAKLAAVNDQANDDASRLQTSVSALERRVKGEPRRRPHGPDWPRSVRRSYSDWSAGRLRRFLRRTAPIRFSGSKCKL